MDPTPTKKTSLLCRYKAFTLDTYHQFWSYYRQNDAQYQEN